MSVILVDKGIVRVCPEGVSFLHAPTTDLQKLYPFYLLQWLATHRHRSEMLNDKYVKFNYINWL
jgi:hypothetical protein